MTFGSHVRWPRSGAFLIAAFALLPVSRVHAQAIVPTIDLGASALQQGDSVSTWALALSPALRLDWDRATLGGAGTLSTLAGSWLVQGTANASLYSAPLGPFVGELAGTAGGSAQSGSRTGQGMALARAHVMGAGRGLWAGGGGGRTWDGVISRRVVQADAGAWVRFDGGTVLLSVDPTTVDDSLHYTDVQLAARWRPFAVELAAAVGHRAGYRSSAVGGDAPWWGSATATVPLAPARALVVSGGVYAADFTQGFPGGRYVSVALRLGAVTSGEYLGRDRTRQAEGVTAFQIVRVGRGVIFRVLAPQARSVEISGDFTMWQPVRLEHVQGDLWATDALTIPAGSHEMAIRVDGGAWAVPPGLTALVDEMGGSSGLLVIP